MQQVRLNTRFNFGSAEPSKVVQFSVGINTRGTVHQLLTNEKYVGNNVYNRTSFKLKQKRVRNTPDMWVRSDGAFEGVVPLEVFTAAQKLIAARSQQFDEPTMLQLLKGLYDGARQGSCRLSHAANGCLWLALL
jgi:hypothetical protein